MNNSIYQPKVIRNYFLSLNLYQIFSMAIIRHMLSIIICALSIGYRGKTVDFERHSDCHRTTVAYFLNHGKWDDGKLEGLMKSSIIRIIYQEAQRSGKPIYCIVDDTIASKTKPSSQALHPIEDAYFHHSHLKKKQDYGHQAVAVMLSCNGITLNYAIILYDKTKSKIKLVQEIAQELPVPPVLSYFLCDSWYTSQKVMDSFLVKGFLTIGALKSNRVIYPCGIKNSISSFAAFMRESDRDIRLVTVGSRQYHVYRYEGNLNGTENAVVLITYPKGQFHNPKALRAFICTDCSLTTDEILAVYTNRWPIELFFRQCKGKLALDSYQIRSSQGIKRF